MKFLDSYFDPKVKLLDEDTEARISRAEQDRLKKLFNVATTASMMPRRLTDAMPEDLAADKLKARRMAHVATNSLKSWGASLEGMNGYDVRREAAIVDWNHWSIDHQIYLLQRQFYIATWAISTGGDQRWAKSAITKLSNERTWIERALR